MTVFVHSHNDLFSDVSPGLPPYSNHNVTKYNTIVVVAAAAMVVVVVVAVVVVVFVVFAATLHKF
jgi:hypothetical protein